MRLLSQKKLNSLKPVLAGLMAGFLFLMSLATANNGLHHIIHAEESQDHGPCAVCAIAQGQVDVPLVTVSEVFASLSVAWTLPSVQIITPAAIDLMVAPSRGPPVSVSSQS